MAWTKPEDYFPCPACGDPEMAWCTDEAYGPYFQCGNHRCNAQFDDAGGRPGDRL